MWRRKKDSLSHALEVFELFMMCILKLFKTLKRLNIVKCEVVSDSILVISIIINIVIT